MRYRVIFASIAAAGAASVFSPVQEAVADALKFDIRNAPQEVYGDLAEGRDYGAAMITAFFAACAVGVGFSGGASLDEKRQAAAAADLASRSSSRITSATNKISMPDNIDEPTILRNKNRPGLG